ncbi:flavodoxin FldA [Buchnera aphidicola (Mindarus keteleerifoliae)]|uniref:flavodoxin FldA n=1 Tax=Buchnera aphidicola TaxID=9 RepID=UPI0031B68661
MKKIGIFFGSDTGNTELVAKQIFNYLGEKKSKLFDIANSNKKEVESFNRLIFGIPTWFYGEIQSDWDDFLPILKKINFKKKVVAFFGCGDQEDYGEYFCDAMRIVYDVVKNNEGKVIGRWPSKNYFFESSKALLDKNHFLGLTLDEDRQPEFTQKRIEIWIKNLIFEFENIKK